MQKKISQRPHGNRQNTIRNSPLFSPPYVCRMMCQYGCLGAISGGPLQSARDIKPWFNDGWHDLKLMGNEIFDKWVLHFDSTSDISVHLLWKSVMPWGANCSICESRLWGKTLSNRRSARRAIFLAILPESGSVGYVEVHSLSAPTQTFWTNLEGESFSILQPR